MFIFISQQQLSLLKQLRLPFCAVNELNDPFIENKRVHMPGANQPLSDSEFAAGVNKMYQALAPHIQAMVTFEYYLEQTQQKRGQVEAQLHASAASTQHSGLASLEHYKNVACLSLYKNIYQQGLWQSLGVEEGVAIKLDDTHPYFREPAYQSKPQLLAPVMYDDARPPLPSKQQPFPALLHRAEHFKYEQQWRLIRPLAVLDKNKEGQLNAKVPKGVISGLYAGLHCSDETINMLQNLVEHDLNFRKLPLKRIGVSETHLRLVATSIN